MQGSGKQITLRDEVACKFCGLRFGRVFKGEETDTKPADGRLGEALAKLFNTKHIEPFGLVLDNERLKSAESLRVLLDKSDVQALRAEIERQRQQGQGGNGNS